MPSNLVPTLLSRDDALDGAHDAAHAAAVSNPDPRAGLRQRVRPGLRLRARAVAATVAAAAALGLAVVPQGASAVQPLQQLDVVLLQPGTLIEQRVTGGADTLADYLKRLGNAEADAMRGQPQQLPVSGFIVVAIRSGGQAHAWFDFRPPLAVKTQAALAHVAETVTPPPVHDGNVVFALRVSLWGAPAPERYAPVPPEWREAGRQAGHKLDLDALVDQLWPH